jgi:hypothetical protein
MTELKVLESLKNIKAISTFYLFMILYFFSIDIITAKYLGYYTKDLLFLIDIQHVVYITSSMLLIFVIIGLIVKKSLIASFTVVAIFIMLYMPNHGSDWEYAFKILIAILLLIVVLVHNIYDEYIISFLEDNILYLNAARVFIGIVIGLLIYVQIKHSTNNWKVFKFKDKVELRHPITPNIIFESKSFNPIHLQSLNQNLKVFANQEIINNLSKKIFETNKKDKDFFLVPYDNYDLKKYKLTVNYYDNKDIRNIFIINPNTCITNQCELHTLIVKQIHKNDISKGFNLISKYTNKVSLDIKPSPIFKPSFLDR